MGKGCRVAAGKELIMERLMSKDWWEKATVRAIKTAAEAAVAMIGTGAVGILSVDWVNLASVTCMAVVVSYLISLGGLPEADPNA